MSAREWLRDLTFGVRLAFRGRRPWSRLAVTAFGVGLGVALLLGAASVPVAYQARSDREINRVGFGEPSEHAALLMMRRSTEFHGKSVDGMLLESRRPDAPVAPGLVRNPAPGELMVSPALQEVLSGPGGDLLRPRLPGPVAGTIGPEGLAAPDELYFYQGADALDSRKGASVVAVNHHFGEQSPRSSDAFTEDSWYVLALGIAALLVPVVVYVSATVRLAEAARQRRMAAMRLVGASGRQIRRISTGEALVGTVLGVAFGWALYLTARAFVGHVSVMDYSLFPVDIRPVWWLAALVTLGIPVLAVLVTIAAMRQSVVEPLGVTRQSVSRPRKLIWRLLPLLAGVAGLLFLTTWSRSDRIPVFVGSTVMVLVAIPLLLPWCVERAVGRLRGGGPAWQLAVRRLQLSSGTAARSVSAIAVVVSGVIAVQMALAGAAADAGDPGPAASAPDRPHLMVSGAPATASAADETVQRLRAIDGVSGELDVETRFYLTSERGSPGTSAVIADCATINRMTPVPDCRDGDAFLSDAAGSNQQEGTEQLQAGQAVEFYNTGVGNSQEDLRWQVPPGARRVAGLQDAELVITPAAGTAVPLAYRDTYIQLSLGPAASPDAIEHVRNVAETSLVGGQVSELGAPQVSEEALAIAAVRAVLLAGAALTFALIGCSLFVLAAEQIQERRRPLAVLGAVGVSRRTLSLSVLLQNGVPMLVATVLAGVVGVVLGLLTLTSIDSSSVGFDLPGMLGLFGLAAIAVIVVTALTLPALGRATDPEGLRTE